MRGDRTPGLHDCAAAVLAGGRGERFGGDKPLAAFRGATLLAHLLGQLASLGFAQLLVAAKEPRRLAAAVLDARGEMVGMPTIGMPQIAWVADVDASFNPLSGLCSALRASRCEWLFACAADMPFAADRALLEALVSAAPGASAVTPVHAGEVQPLCALWNRARSLAAAEALLQSGKGGPRALLELLGATQLEWKDARPFLDADTREELSELEREPS
jgi:molybdopterin-guanine dinucleotide biosynthesis protein A